MLVVYFLVLAAVTIIFVAALFNVKDDGGID